MKRVLSYVVLGAVCLIAGYLVGVKHGSHSDAGCSRSGPMPGLYPWDDEKTLFASRRDDHGPLVIEFTGENAAKPYLIKGVSHSLKDVEAMLNHNVALYGGDTCAIVAARENISIGALFAVVKIAKKYCAHGMTILLNETNQPCSTVAFSNIDQGQAWRRFTEFYHLSSLAPFESTKDKLERMLESMPDPKAANHSEQIMK